MVLLIRVTVAAGTYWPRSLATLKVAVPVEEPGGLTFSVRAACTVLLAPVTVKGTLNVCAVSPAGGFAMIWNVFDCPGSIWPRFGLPRASQGVAEPCVSVTAAFGMAT